MQPDCARGGILFRILHRRYTSLLLLAALAGCSQGVTTIDPPVPRPYQGKALHVSCSFAANVDPVTYYVNEWAVWQEADVRVTRDDPDRFAGDVAIVTAAELPALAETGRYRAVPEALRGRAHSFQWEGLLPNYAGLLSTWKGVSYGVPLLGEGRVLVYRKDRFEAAKLAPPQTWDDYLAAAEKLNAPGAPSLPPISAFPAGLDAEFHAIAACYDRLALARSEAGAGGADETAADHLFSYQYRLKTAAPRINAPAFVRAFELLRRLRPLRAPGQDAFPLRAFQAGKASLGIATLEDVARLQAADSPVRGKFGVAPLPGASSTFDLETGKEVPSRLPNRVTYFGVESLFGLVSQSCADPEMAFDFLTGFAHPERTGAELITAARYGAGPLRAAHTEERTRALWLGYDLPPKETDALVDALKQYLAPSIVNPRFKLRLPNQQAHAEAFDRIVRPALLAETADAKATLNEVNASWEALWKGVPDNARRSWVRANYGLGAE
jgi:multiple sugar transport system substrate-binding protein